LVAVLATWALVLAVSRWIALASILASVCILVIALVVHQDIAWAAAIAAIVAARHSGNIARRLGH